MAVNIKQGAIGQPVNSIRCIPTVPSTVVAGAPCRFGSIPGIAHDAEDSNGFVTMVTDVIAEISVIGRTSGSATATLTSNNTNVSDADTVTIGGKTYTFKTTLTPTEGEVLIGLTADASLLNLIRAINHSGTPDTDYKCAVANQYVSAASSVTAHAFAVTARVPGLAGTSIVTLESAVTLSWSSAVLVLAVTANAVIAVGDTVYLQNDGTVDGDSRGVRLGEVIGAALSEAVITDTRSGTVVTSGSTTTVRVWVKR